MGRKWTDAQKAAASARRVAVTDRQFWDKVIKHEDGYWEWTGTLTPDNYGRYGKPLAHRRAYEMMVGPIPAGSVLDHLCHNADDSCHGGPECPHRRCVNPAHLEPVSDKVNILRSTKTAAAINAAKTHCPQGHELTPDNVYLSRQSGGRVGRKCRTCVLARDARTRARRKDQPGD